MSSDAVSANEQPTRTMLELKPEQRELLADKLGDAANLAAGALVFGQFLGGQGFSWASAVGGIGIWAILIAVAYFIRKV